MLKKKNLRYKVPMMLPMLCFGILGLAQNSWAKDLFVATNGNDLYDGSFNTPVATISQGMRLAQPGDIIYMRSGSYVTTSTIQTTRAGSPGYPITLKSYPNEVVNISGNGLGELIQVEHPYWIFDGLRFTATNVLDHDHGIISVGYNNEANHFVIQNSYLNIASANASGRDNLSCIRLQAYRSNYAAIRNNEMHGFIYSGTYGANGVQYLGGQNVGTKILNNDFRNFSLAVYVKHLNFDTSSTGAEIAYNYFHGCNYGFYGTPAYINFHDNLLVGADITLGDDGGRGQGHHNTINHNTCSIKGIHLMSPGIGPMRDCVITNNIFTTKTTDSYSGDTQALNTWDYNMYGDDPAIGPHDIGVRSPTYLGGASPSNIAGFALTSTSFGKGSASDGTDIGANINLVGVGPAITNPYDLNADGVVNVQDVTICVNMVLAGTKNIADLMAVVNEALK